MPTATKKRKPYGKDLVEAKAAVKAAESFLRNLYPARDLTSVRVEAIELNAQDWAEGHDSVVLSFIPSPDSGENELALSALHNPRLYKQFIVRSADGYVTRMGDPID